MLEPTILRARLLLILTLIVVVNVFVGVTMLFFGLERVSQINVSNFINGILRIVVTITFFGLLAPQIIVFIKSYVSQSYNWKRLLIELATINLIATLLGITLYFLFPISRHDYTGPAIRSIIKAPLLCFIFGCVIFAIYEAWMNLYDNNHLQTSLQKLEKDQLTLRLNSLQQKLDPHFMFNSLNVLSELVHEDSDKADKFIHQFSKVYRYVLDLNDESFVPLSKELECLDSYLYLLDIRMGESLKVTNTINSNLLTRLIPPLSLQLLIENAIKHNSASKTSPLEIELKSEGNTLIISNNRSHKTELNSVGGLGLQKLKQTYELLNQTPPKILESEFKFTVHLPLIKLEND